MRQLDLMCRSEMSHLYQTEVPWFPDGWRMCLRRTGSGTGSGADLGRRRTCWVMTQPKLSSALVISLLSAGEVYGGVSLSTWRLRALWETLMSRVWSDWLLCSLTDSTCCRCSPTHTRPDPTAHVSQSELQSAVEIMRNMAKNNNYHKIE